MDMWKPFRNVTKDRAPQAAILFDKFHIMRHLGEALDKVRKAEAGCLGTANSAIGARQRPPAPQARARRADHRRPKQNVRGTGAADGGRQERGCVMLALAKLTPHVGLSSACRAFAMNRGLAYCDRARASQDRLTGRAAGAGTAPVGTLGR